MATGSKVQKWLNPSVPFHIKLVGNQGMGRDLAFSLCLDFNALSLVEERTGIPLTDPSKIFSLLNATNIKVLLWAAVQAYHPEYEGDEGLEVIGSFLTFKTSASAVDALWEAFLNSVPEETAARLRAVLEAAKAGEQAPEAALDPTATAQSAA